MKRIVYILLSMFLGLLLSFFAHVALEMPALSYLVEGGAHAGDAPVLIWTRWQSVHEAGTVLIALAGLVGGWFLGRYWWRLVYVERRRFKWGRRSVTLSR